MNFAIWVQISNGLVQYSRLTSFDTACSGDLNIGQTGSDFTAPRALLTTGQLLGRFGRECSVKLIISWQ